MTSQSPVNFNVNLTVSVTNAFSIKFKTSSQLKQITSFNERFSQKITMLKSLERALKMYALISLLVLIRGALCISI